METIRKEIKVWKPELSNISPKAKIGEGTVIHAGVHIHDDVVIGRNCKIQAMAFIPNGVHISSDVFVGPGVIFTNDPDLNQEGEFKPVETIVKPRVKIGAGAMILAGVTIGRAAVIGMGSVVLKDVEPGHVVVGNPAKTIKVKSDFSWYE